MSAATSFTPAYHSRWTRSRKFRALSPLAKLVYDYLTANESVTYSGIYTLSVERAASETGLSRDEVTRCLAEISGIHERIGAPRAMIYWEREAGVVFVVGQWKHAYSHSPAHKARVGNEFLKSFTLPFWDRFFRFYPSLQKYLSSRSFKARDEFKEALENAMDPGEGPDGPTPDRQPDLFNSRTPRAKLGSELTPERRNELTQNGVSLMRTLPGVHKRTLEGVVGHNQSINEIEKAGTTSDVATDSPLDDRPAGAQGERPAEGKGNPADLLDTPPTDAEVDRHQAIKDGLRRQMEESEFAKEPEPEIVGGHEEEPEPEMDDTPTAKERFIERIESAMDLRTCIKIAGDIIGAFVSKHITGEERDGLTRFNAERMKEVSPNED